MSGINITRDDIDYSDYHIVHDKISSTNYIESIFMFILIVSTIIIVIINCDIILNRVTAEILFYVIPSIIIYHIKFIAPQISSIISIPFAILFSTASVLTLDRFKNIRDSGSVFLFVNSLFYAIVSLHLESQVFAFIAVVCTIGVIGRSSVFAIVEQGFGVIGRIISFPCLVIVAIALYCDNLKLTNPFRVPMLWIGSTGYLVAIPIVFAKTNTSQIRYLLMQLIAVSSLGIALHFGAVYNIVPLYSLSWIISVTYVIEKFAENFSSKNMPYIAFFISIGVLFLMKTTDLSNRIFLV